ncbi:MAG: tRNA (adenosine(37)-N6)-dimethylallyltransferase MiaA [Bacteroidetes bacterium]|nr:tRNA (adenosine(37)-N6)-dimethylallyltransferase MiaA [Bacteroidota bacterium]
MKELIIIAGPTASGKTSLAIQVAKKLNCPIISADSRQVYKELNIGVARPTPQELSQAEHYFIASHSIKDALNAGQYEKEVLILLDNLFKKHDKVILCGGTGLYIKAIMEGLDTLPPASEKLRKELKEKLENEGIESLQKILKQIDPVFYSKVEIQNPQRLIRAIEIAKSSNKSNLELRLNKKQKRNFSTIAFCIDIKREQLYSNINQRVDAMLESGLEQEVRRLIPYRNFESLKTVGYKEFFDYFDGKTDYQTCINLIKQNTRRYAKRQVTWFKNQGNFIFKTADKILAEF